MGFREMVEADLDTVFFNTNEFADTVTQWPQGDAGRAVEVTAIFIPEESRRELRRGEEIVRPAVLWVKASVEVHHKDQWEIGGETYQTLKFDPLEHGARRVEIQRNDKSHTSRPGAGQLL
jgi:hypothetical protein